MSSRWRPYLLGILGLAALTFPFLWLQLAPDFTNNTVGVAWAPLHGLQFFGDLSPVFVIALLIWLGVRANRRFGWDQALAANPAWQRAGRAWTHYWAWGTMPLVLSCAFFFSASSLSLLTTVGIYMLLALGLNITVGMTGLLVLGYAGFYGFGAYFFALAQQNLPYFPWWMAAPLAFFLGGGVGYLLGLPCLRLRGDYLAIVTLGFAEAFREMMRNLSNDDTASAASSPFFRELAHHLRHRRRQGHHPQRPLHLRQDRRHDRRPVELSHHGARPVPRGFPRAATLSLAGGPGLDGHPRK